MPDPRAAAFAQQYGALTSPQERDEFKKTYAQTIYRKDRPDIAWRALLDSGEAIGEDLTHYVDQRPTIDPTPVGQIRTAIDDRIKSASLWRRGIQKAVAGVEWWQKNAVEPSAALVMSQALQLVPGKQSFERKLDEAQAQIQAQRTLQQRNLNMADHIRAAREAYRQTDTPWGLKGFMELVFDPLNLVGLGIPAKVGKVVPALKPLLAPITALDNAPNVVAKGVISGGASLAKKIPGVKQLAQPHWTAQVKETTGRVYQSLTEEFGPRIADADPAVTREVLSDLSKFPSGAGPYSLRNVMDKLGEIVTKEKGAEGWIKWHDNLMNLPPQVAANTIAGLVGQAERNAFLKGGERLGGEIIEGTIQQRRQKGIAGIIERMGIDEQRAAATSAAIDKHVYGWIDNVYLRKIEPNIVRPWAMAHLAFFGFGPINLFEDVGMSAVGMGNIGKFAADDRTFSMLTAGLTDTAAPPEHLLRAEQQQRDMLDVMMGVYKTEPKGLIAKAADMFTEWTIRKSSRTGWGIRRAGWLDKYQREFGRALDELGIPPQEVSALRDVVQTEFPQGLEHLRQEIGQQVWAALSTGNPEHVRSLREHLNTARYVQRAQAAIINEYPNMPPEVRRAFLSKIFKEGGITPDNANELTDKMREELLEWHRFSPEGIKARLGDFVDALGDRPPKSSAEAASLLRMLQHAGDTISAAPREIRAHYREMARTAVPSKRGELWEQSLKVIEDDLGDVRKKYEAALARSRPHVERLLGQTVSPGNREAVKRSTDEIFDAYENLSKNLQTTWEEYRTRVQQHFADTAPADRDGGFWAQFELLGDEIWSAEKMYRAEQANIARTGWNSIFETLPSNLSGKDKHFVKAGVEAALNDADARLDDLQLELLKIEDAIPNAPDTVRTALDAKAERIKSAIVIAASHRKQLEAHLNKYNTFNRSVVPPELSAYDKTIRGFQKAIKHARAADLDNQIPDIEVKLNQAIKERQTAFEALIPAFMKSEYAQLRATRETALQLGQSTRSIDSKLRAFQKRVESGVDPQVGGVTRALRIRLSGEVLRATQGKAPETVDDFAEILFQLEEQGVAPATELANLIEGNPEKLQETVEQLYSQTVAMASQPKLTPLQVDTLRNAQKSDLLPTRAIVGLVSDGYFEAPTKLSDGKWRLKLTPKGEEAVAATSGQKLNVDAILAELPTPVRAFETALDEQMADMRSVLSKAVDTYNNPPLAPGDATRVGAYVDKIANTLERRPDLQKSFGQARQLAGERANESYSRFFINYDNRTSFDSFMQHLMPFWMYESRRWPRLIALAGKRPVLAKYFTLIGGEQDYGYVPTPWGYEFNPTKGVIATGLRRTLGRDFPEFHTGYRGAIENSFDWLSRGGFYFAPPITAAQDILSGEPANIIPPPISLMLHGLSATGAMPEGIEQLAFSSRYHQYLIDQVIADKFKKSPQEVRRLAETGDEDAESQLFLAKREAALRIIALNQTSVLRYRPAAKRAFGEDSKDAVERILGVPKADQKVLADSGVSVYEVIAASRFQRTAMREAIPNYDAWVSASVALRPAAEQKIARTIDAFWAEMDRAQVDFEKKSDDISRRWENGFVSGSGARDELSRLLQARATLFENIKNRADFKDVPVTMEERLAYARRFNKPAPLVHPVDELLEQYYQITPEKFYDEISGETDWKSFYDTRNELLNNAPPQIASAATDAMRNARTPLEAALEDAAPYIQAYYGIRGELMDQLEQTDPGATVAYRAYSQARNLSQLAETPDLQRRYAAEAVRIAAANPNVRRVETTTRLWREQFRAQDPKMAEVYRMFIQTAPSFPRA